MSHRIISSEGCGDCALRASERSPHPVSLGLPPPAFGAAWLSVGAAAGPSFLCACAGGFWHPKC